MFGPTGSFIRRNAARQESQRTRQMSSDNFSQNYAIFWSFRLRVTQGQSVQGTHRQQVSCNPFHRVDSFEYFEIRIIFMWEIGLLESWMRPHRGRYDQCVVKAIKPKMAKIKVRDWYSAFVLLAIGSSLAFIVFIYEVTHRCCKTRVPEILNWSETWQSQKNCLAEAM